MIDLYSLYINMAAVGILMLGLWLVSLLKKDVSIVDPFWSIGFLVIAVVTAFGTGRFDVFSVLLITIVALWSLRLAIHLFVRNHGEPEDPRYQAFRKRFGAERYWWVSLFQVFGLQGLLMLIISAPLQHVLSASSGPYNMWMFTAGSIVAITGLSIEGIADWQLQKFRSDESLRGLVMNRGLWYYSRHPNYFGNATLWWGFWIMAAGFDGGWMTVYSPLLMTFLLVRVSGVSLLESSLKKTKPAYVQYVKTTSAFIPMKPKKEENND